MFRGNTRADKADIVTIRTNPNSVPDGIWLTTYGSKKIYSDIISRPTNMVEKITMDKIRYFGFENTRWIADII